MEGRAMTDPTLVRAMPAANVTGDPYGPPEPDLRTYLRVLSRRKWIILLTTVAVGGAALGLSLLQTTQYTGIAQVLLQPTQTVQLNNSASGTPTLTPTDITTQIQLVNSTPVKLAVEKQLGLPQDTTKAPKVDVTEVGQTNVIQIAATDPRPKQAARVANAYANNYITVQQQQEVGSLLAAASQIESKITSLDSQIAILDAQAKTAPPGQQAGLAAQRTALVNQEAAFKAEQAQFQLNSALQNGGAQLVTPAVVPTSPSSPKKKRNFLLGMVIGLILGIGAAFGLEYIDDSIRSKEDLEKAGVGLNVLGLIPEVATWKDESVPQVIAASAPTSTVAETYRSLRTSIQFVGIDRPMRIIQVTSAVAQEGKSTTLANLGVVLAQAGQRVAMVCCDLRRPRLHEFFGLDNAVGFTSVLLGHSSLADAVQPALPDQDHLWLLASGPPPPNPSELLSSPLAGEVLRTLASEFDTVLVDSPPVLPVTDGAVLSAHVDGVVLVAVAGLTGSKQLGRCIELLAHVNAPLIGTVLNGVSDAAGYGYSYRYGGSPSYTARQAAPEQRAPAPVREA